MGLVCGKVARAIEFCEVEVGTLNHPTLFGRNLQLLRELKIGFSQNFADAINDREHAVRRFFSIIDLEKDIRTAVVQRALWLTELSIKFDAQAGAPKIRLIAENLHTPIRGRRFVLHFREII